MAIQIGVDTTEKSYDVVVYQTASHTYAADADGRRISSTLISNQTDDIVINAALEYLDGLVTGYTTGKTMKIASGTYYITKVLTVDKPHTIRGAGTTSTILKARVNTSLQTLFDINPDAYQWGGGSASWSAYAGGNFVMSDMTLNGNHDCETAILFGNYISSACNPEVTHAKFDNIRFADFTHWGVFDNSTFGSNYTNCLFTGNGNPVAPGNLTTHTMEAGTNTTHIHAPLSTLEDIQYYYDLWYLYNITRGVGVPIYNYENVGKIIEFPSGLTIASQAAGDTFVVFPPYGGAAIFGIGHYQCTFVGCTFNQNAMGIYMQHARESEIRDCFFYDNYYHGIYMYGGSGYSAKYNRISGCFFYDSGAYNSPGTTNGLYDIFISYSGNWYNSISEIFTFDTYVKSSLYTNGNYTTILNYQTESGSIGTLGGTGSVNMNTLVAEGATASIADGGTITHGLGSTPTWAIVTGSVAGEIITVTAIGATTFTVAVKGHDGSAGTTQTIYWRCGI